MISWLPTTELLALCVWMNVWLEQMVQLVYVVGVLYRLCYGRFGSLSNAPTKVRVETMNSASREYLINVRVLSRMHQNRMVFDKLVTSAWSNYAHLGRGRYGWQRL
jgi:hypothetical protein